MSALARAYTERDGSIIVKYADFDVEYRDASHRYWLHEGGARTPAVSVTSALNVLDKPALLDWAEDYGARGAALLAAQGELDGVAPEDVVGLVRLHKLGKDAKRDVGADRGTAVHDVLERWATSGDVPDLADFDVSVRGYVQGLCAWLLKARPVPTAIEQIVGSVIHGYAGRMDLRATLDGVDTIIDLKTNPKGRVYDEAHLQAQAYSLAHQECGADPPQDIVIVAVGEEGNYEQVPCEAEEGDWLAVLECHRSVSRIKAAGRARWRAQKAASEAAA